tara:strand:+ start:12127 stop:12537 length:411 start_codon:yes stop_codon:yes gene_type:complete
MTQKPEISPSIKNVEEKKVKVLKVIKKRRTNPTIKLKKGDNVLVLTGKDKGKLGSILSIFPKKNKATVKGVNIVKKHQKPSRQGGGGIVEKELPVHISNLSFVSLKDQKKTKISYKLEEKKKIRIERRTGDVIKSG